MSSNNLKAQTTDYQELKGDDEILFQGEMDSLNCRSTRLKNSNFDIMRLPDSGNGGKKLEHLSCWHFCQATTRGSRSWRLRFSGEPERKTCKAAMNQLKVILKNQPPQPVFFNAEGDLTIKKLPPKLISKKATAQALTQLSKPPDAKIIISMLKKEPHPSYKLHQRGVHNVPLRGVCLRQSQENFDSQSVPGDDVIDVTKALALRIVASSEVVNLITGLSFGKLAGALGESTGVFDALAMGSKYLTDRTTAHQNLIGMVPLDRVSLWSYWWGYEIALPTPSVERLKQARSIETAAMQVLAAMTVTAGAIEIFPLIKYLSAYLDIEWNAINAENKGRGVVIAATWALPMALIPRAWDLDEGVTGVN